MTKELIAGLERMRRVGLQGFAAGLDVECSLLQDELRQTTAHGDQTGATRAAYGVWRVGLGKTGSAELSASIAAGESLNPGQTGTSTVSIQGELGVVFSDPMIYGPDRETARAGEKATIGPIVASSGSGLTQAGAAGMKQALNG